MYSEVVSHNRLLQVGIKVETIFRSKSGQFTKEYLIFYRASSRLLVSNADKAKSSSPRVAEESRPWSMSSGIGPVNCVSEQRNGISS